jgi:filamentous hemagglutinin family protein
MDESPPRSRHPDSIGTAILWALLPTLLLVINAPDTTYAQVATIITPSALPACPGPCGPGVTIVTLPPPGTTVTTISGGARPGNGPNLFHSFGQFDVGTGDVANFQNTPVNGAFPATSNILSRVTGGNPSQIYGTIQTTDFPGANLFLMNPAGVLFGATAVLDLGAVTGSAVRQPGSFYATTADYLNLGDANGTTPFYADPAQTSVLSVAPVAAFGFTASNPVSITLEGSTLMVGQGQTLSIVGGNKPFNKTIQEDPLTEPVPSGVTVTGGMLSAPGGQINLVSVASPGEVLVPSFQTVPNIHGASFTTMGTVMLKAGATLGVSGQLDVDGNPIGNGNSGTVFVRGGQLVMDASTILAETVGVVDGASTAVDIQVSGNVALNNGSAIYTLTFGTGSGGDVQLTADTLTMVKNAPLILTATGGGGVGGDVVLNVRTVRLMGGASIQSSNQNITPGSGQGGDVIIQGLPGAEFGAAQSVSLFDGSSLVSQTLVSDGGRVAITSKSLTMDGLTTTVNASANDVGRGGDIVARVLQASLSGGATIITQNFTADPNAQAVGTVTVQGLQGAGSMADSVDLSGIGSGIVSDTFGQARAGDVAVHAKTVSLTNGAVIQAGTPSTTAAGGNVTIDADSVDISSGSHISSQASHSDAGQVTITANTLILDNGSIATNTSSEGRGGDVAIDVGTVSLSNGAKINSSTSESGRAGDITMSVGRLTLANNSEITNSSSGGIEIEAGAGDAGNITIQSGSTVVMNNSLMTTEAKQASGGQIVITAPEMVRLINSQVSTSVADGTGGGGNITIDPQFVILQNSQIIAQAFAGSGGEINVTAGVFLRDPASIVSASSQQGPQGTVNIQSPVQNLGEQLTPLSQQFSSAAALLAQRCAARVADGKFSTFVVAGREGLPVEPGGFLASPSWTAEQFGSNLSAQYPNRLIAAVTGSFPEYDAKPIQLAKYGDACRQ